MHKRIIWIQIYKQTCMIIYTSNQVDIRELMLIVNKPVAYKLYYSVGQDEAPVRDVQQEIKGSLKHL